MIRRRYGEVYRGSCIVCTRWLWGRWHVTVGLRNNRIRVTYGCAKLLTDAIVLGRECIDGKHALADKAWLLLRYGNAAPGDGAPNDEGLEL